MPVERSVPHIPADTGKYLDGEPPVRLENLPPGTREKVKRALAAKVGERRERGD